jgi:pseudaminic acid cytidylyltransferase
MSKVAIIPARGGSKRIPRKNIKDFLGKPVIAYSIETAINSNLFDEVMVSTDDEEIASIAEKYGAKVPFYRSKKNSDDRATTVDVLLEVLGEYEKLDVKLKTGCCIYPTAPLLKRQVLLDAYNLMMKEQYDAVFPVVKFSYPIWRSLKLEGSKSAMIWPEHLNTRSQDLADTFHDAGQFYWFFCNTLLENKVLFGKNAGSIVLPESEVQDIDSLQDWRIAEIKYETLYKK